MRTFFILLILQAYLCAYCLTSRAEDKPCPNPAGDDVKDGRILMLAPIDKKAHIPEELARAEKGRFTTIYACAFTRGGAYYHSSACPVHKHVSDKFKPFPELLTQAREKGIRVYALLALFYWNDEMFKICPYRMQISGKGQSGAAPCFYRPETRELMVKIAREVIERFGNELDGVVIDLMPYNWETYCTCDYCRKTFQERAGSDITRLSRKNKPADLEARHRAWRNEVRTALISEIYQGVKKRPNHLPVVVIVSPKELDYGASLIRLHAADKILMMDYVYYYSDADGPAKQFRAWLNTQLQHLGADRLIAGLAAFRFNREKQQREPKTVKHISSEIELLQADHLPFAVYYSHLVSDAQLKYFAKIAR
ncbi:hypothetical protein ACFLQR_04365 [Verrucomicrobiota bacterium]